MKFFKEGEKLGGERLPPELDTPEFRQAMKTLQRFSDKQRDYDLYQRRMNALRAERTWMSDLAEAKQAKEQAQQDAEQAQQNAEQAQQNAERAQQAAEQERQAKEEALIENKRLRKTLRKAGLDPDAKT